MFQRIFANLISRFKPVCRFRKWLAVGFSMLSAFTVDSKGAYSQISYPATQYSSFQAPRAPQDQFAISPPLKPDSPNSNSSKTDYRSMSPDSWENPQPHSHRFSNPNFNGHDPANSIIKTPQADLSWPATASMRSTGMPSLDGLSIPLEKSGSASNQPSENQTDFRPNSGSQVNATPFRPAAHPIKKSGDSEPMSQTPMVPTDIRLPELLPPSVFSIRQDSVLESNPADRTGSSRSGAGRQDSAPGRLNDGLFDVDELQLDPSRMNQYDPPILPGDWRVETAPDNRSYPADSTSRPSRTRRPLPTPFLAAPDLPQNADYSGPFISEFANQPLLMPHLGSAAKAPDYRPDLGHRSPRATQRESHLNDYGQKFDFETKHGEYPGLGEILATGRYFGSATLLYLRPAFQANTSIFQNRSGITDTFDFSYKLADQFQLGFESKFGPGIELDYWGYHDFSRAAQFTSDGIESGTTSAWMRGAHQWSRLTAANVGESLVARHRMEVDVIGVSFFKEVKLPKARINGKFGFETAHIVHELTAELRDSGGTQTDNLRARSDVRAFGPQFRLEYFRPVGHTKIEFTTCVGGSMLFGKQTQVIENSAGPDQSRLRADEFVMTFDYFAGVQYRKMWGENRCYFARAGMVYQVWSHGGTAVQPQDDFGFRGFSLTAGINR
jgi:hypothetical protein